MNYKPILTHSSEFRVKKMCQVLDVSRSSYYAWLNRPQSDRDRENGSLLEEICKVHVESRGLYGSLRVTRKLNNNGIKCGKNRVAHIMKDNGIQSRIKRKFKATTNSKHNYPVAENILDQDFGTSRINEVCIADITYVPSDEGWLYFAGIVDLHRRKVVGWSMDSTMTQQLTIDALKQALMRECPLKGVIHHSDRGSQYAANGYRKLLSKNGFKQSMSRKGNCYDNACMESFFGTLNTELIYLTRFKTRDEAKQAIFDYVEFYYNRVRLHSALGYKSPFEFEKQCKAA
jgi:putative transposase